MILSLLGAAIVTFFLQIALVIGLPDVVEAAKIGGTNVGFTIQYILEAHVGSTITRILSCLLGIAFLSCAGAVQGNGFFFSPLFSIIVTLFKLPSICISIGIFLCS
jgi:hypothetical protein